MRRSWQPFTVFPSKRATRPSRSASTSCKHYCHAFLHHGRKCLSPCARRRPGHYRCRCVRHQSGLSWHECFAADFFGFALSFNSTVTTHLAIMYPHYFEYHIERGVEWIRIFHTGPWQPGQLPWDVSRTTLPRIGSGASHTTLTDSTGGTAADPNVMPMSYASYHVWEFRDWNTQGYQRLGNPRPTIGSTELVNEEIASSSESSVPDADGAWREPSPPPSYDPNFGWNESD